MNPAFSVIFLTTLIGTGQGLFLALFIIEARVAAGLLAAPSVAFYWIGSTIAVVLLAAGLLASFFHLGHPERAWRSAAMWRTSWLSREVIALPAFMAAVAAYGWAHWQGVSGTLVLGAAGVVLCLALFLCTAMIYACIKFLQEWATPLTLVNFIVLGCASGVTLAAALAAYHSEPMTGVVGAWAIALTVAGLLTRVAVLWRNARLKARSSLQTAIGIKHPRIAQKAQGFMGGSFNTREFFHGRAPGALRMVKWGFLTCAFVIPVLLLTAGLAAPTPAPALLGLACAVQFGGLLAERWYFFAQANHPQNLYYQAVS
ncbi:MAG: DmsC/YnfH family molybdoenzyme membrane anchor subunit [Burkholderiales bacterium]|nr:DmsC/YnfH family molybdoenzyme membrane anchor subunit [Burkholderiales bacterium]